MGLSGVVNTKMISSEVVGRFFKEFALAFFWGGVLIGLFFVWSLPVRAPAPSLLAQIGAGEPRKKSPQELFAEARAKSSKIKALYMTADVARDGGRGATALREHLIRMADETEINGIVIDVKEVCGPDYDGARLESLLEELHQKNIWAIARIVAFKDASQREAHPEWYLTRKTKKQFGEECLRKKHLRAPSSKFQVPSSVLWQDNRGGYWMDPASQGARAYIADIAKKMIDIGFDELQFDYARFPSDGDVSAAQYPAWDGETPKHAVLKSFFEYLRKTLKQHKPNIILSADIFGYVAAQGEDLTIGQRLDDIGDNFDYVSFMVYPSHYYGGFFMPDDPERGREAVHYTFAEARAHPGVVVGRSLMAARDFFDGIATTSGATSSPAALGVRARIRPWLEDFFHEDDRASGRPWGKEKVRLQIDAAESVEDHGWMLWNAANVYTDEALRKE